MERQEIEKKLSKNLDKERFRHTMGVMYSAAALAMRHGCDLNQAILAGLLHDCAKCIPNDKKMELCKKNKITITETEEKSPFLLHAKLGAFLARTKYEVEEKEILHAIEVHTTGAPDMNLLDKIIYIADYIEPNRTKAKNLDQIRKMAFEDLDLTMLTILKDTLKYLGEGTADVDPMTAKTFQFFQNLCREKEIV